MTRNRKDSSRPTSNKPFMIRLFLSGVTCGAIVNSILSILSCEFFSYEALDGEPWEGLTAPFDNLASASVGLFGYSTKIGDDYGAFGGSCVDYEDWRDVSQQTYFYVAQWCSLVAPAFAALALLQMVLEWCYCRLRASYFIIRVLFVFAALLQLASFLVFLESQYCFDAASQNKCRLRKGSLYAVIATGIYLFMAICFIAMNPYRDGAFCCGCFISTRAVGALVEDVDKSDAEKPEDGDPTEVDDDQDRGQSIVDEEKGEFINPPMEQGFSDELDEDKNIIGQDRGDRYVEASGDFTEIKSSFEMATKEEERPVDQKDTTGDPKEPLESVEPVTHNEAVAVIEADDASSSRRPDFLDMCCGDPLELEKYMSGGKAVKKEESNLYRVRHVSLQEASQKVALLNVDPEKSS